MSIDPKNNIPACVKELLADYERRVKATWNRPDEPRRCAALAAQVEEVVGKLVAVARKIDGLNLLYGACLPHGLLQVRDVARAALLLCGGKP